MSGSLGLDYSQNRASTDAASNSYGYTQSQSQDQSRSMSDSTSGGTSRSGQNVFEADLFRRLYGNAEGAAAGVAAQAPELRQAAMSLFTGGSQFLQTLGGDVGSQHMESRLNDGSGVEDIIASMRTDAANLFSEELNPAITSRAVAGGTLGGGRQGVAQGIAQSRVASDFARDSASLRYADLQAKDQIAAQVAGNSISAANTGLASLPGLLDLVERGNNAELAPYSSLSAIIGGPTTLSESESNDFSRSTAQSVSDAFARAFGEQTAESTTRSRSRGRNYGYSGSFSYGPSGGGE
jgi:hypothetical protein